MIQVLARCAHLRDAAVLRRAGAMVVVAGEAEIGVALSEVVTVICFFSWYVRVTVF